MGKLLQYCLDILFGKLEPVVVEVSFMNTWAFLLQLRLASALAEEVLLSTLCTDGPNQVWFSRTVWPVTSWQRSHCLASLCL